MNLQWTPMRWPAAWKDPAALALLKGAPINCLLLEGGADLGAIATQAKKDGLTVNTDPPAGVRLTKGEFPGVRMGGRGSGASAGPTGVPWLDSNGWKVRLESALHPDAAVWIDAPPKGGRIFPESYGMAFCDSAAFGGRWIITLDDNTALGIAAHNTQAMDGWNRVVAAARFFDTHKEWVNYMPEGVIGVVSDFAGEHLFLSGETLNLLSRANQQYRVMLRGKTSADSWKGLRAVLYVDPEPPSGELRRELESLVRGGVLLIAGPTWGSLAGALARDQELPRYTIHAIGKGRIAIAKAEPADPYVLASDAILLMSHRYELVRFFNAGALSSHLTVSPGRKSALLHLLSYANRGPEDASLRVAGRYRSAKLWTADRPDPRRLEVHAEKDGVELHLPPLSQYAAAELEA